MLDFDIGWEYEFIQEDFPGFDRAAFQTVKAWYEAREGEATGVVLQGPPRVGKTRMMAWLAEQFVRDAGADFAWVTEEGFFNTVGAMGRSSDRADAENELERLADTDWLAFDDFGSLSLTEARMNRLFGLIDNRYKQKRATLWTTNRTPAQLASRIERFWIGQGSSEDEARDESSKLLGRIYGIPDALLAKVIKCHATAEADKR